jgi:hypothetical protein
LDGCTVRYVKNPEAVADAKRLLLFFERRYIERQADRNLRERALAEAARDPARASCG